MKMSNIRGEGTQSNWERMDSSSKGVYPPSPLSKMEMSILYYLAEGYTSNEISQTINRTRNTVQTHVKSLRAKLKAKNTTHAVAIAYHTGLLKARLK